ncbi:MAG: hypothetical protein RL226_642 [Bacteroidota bacterium]
MKSFFTLIFALLLALSAEATHIVGGEIHYEEISPNTYEITLRIYRDCGPTNTNQTYFDDQAAVAIYDDFGDMEELLLIPLISQNISFVPVVLENPCFVLPPDVCVEEAVYQQTVTLPPSATPYTIVYQRCCRNPSIVNILLPEDSGATFTTQIPGTNQTAGNNSNPEFNNFPPVALCQNAAFYFDHSASDEDGDSLAYTFCTPMLGADQFDPMPTADMPPEPPPYANVIWDSGFSTSYPITSDPAFAIDPITGEITGTPTQVGQYVIGVCVEEWRNGVLLSTTNRDFQFNVTICDPNVIAAIPEQEQFCDGLSFEFSAESNAQEFYWDFGDPSTEDDFSTLASPSYTYADTGVYTVMLVANPGWTCADTAYAQYAAYPVVLPIVVQDDFECLNNIGLFDFTAGGDFDSDATFFWDFGSGSSPQTSTAQNPQNISFGSSNDFDITLTISQNGCDFSTTETFSVPPPPQAIVPDQISFCEGLTYSFENNSLNASTYQWNFGVPGAPDNFSIDFEPSYTYPDTGVYVVTLIAGGPNVCPDITTATVEIYWLLDTYFEAPDPQCFEGNQFNFFGEGSEDQNAIWEWSFEGPASTPSVGSQNAFNIHYNESGTFDATLTISANGCVESFTAPVTIEPNPTIDFTASGSGCPPLNASFQNLSTSASQLQVLWEYGDGTTSTMSSASHWYYNTGLYDVTLTITSTGGCVQTLSMTLPDAIQVYPVPEAGFDIEPNVVNILAPNVTVTDLSVGSVQCYYNFGDGGSSDECDLEYSYTGSGLFDVFQTVVNEYGCTDIATGQVAVEGHLFFAPNSFTPNDDGINDVWLPSVIGASEYELTIYNRWGEVIFFTTDPFEPWLGNVHGGDHYAQDGQYVYYVKMHDLLKLPHEFTGHIILIR